MSGKELNSPLRPASPRFSPRRVASNVLLVLLAVAVFVGIWFIPFPKPTPKTTDTRWTPERIKELKEKTRRAEEEVERTEPPPGEEK